MDLRQKALATCVLGVNAALILKSLEPIVREQVMVSESLLQSVKKSIKFYFAACYNKLNVIF